MSSNTVSVALITHNGSAHLAEQLASIAAQSRLPDELVISDDASRDTTVAVCHEFAERAPFAVRIHVNERAFGAAQNRARVIAACTGGIIALSDQDDVWHPEKLSRMEQALMLPNAPALAFCDGAIVDERRESLRVGLWESLGFDEWRQAQVERGHAFEELLKRNFVSGPATLFRTALVALALPIPEGARADAWLALLAAATSGVVAVPDRLFEYRQSTGQQIGAGIQWSSRARRRILNSVPVQLRARLEHVSPMDKALRRLEPLRVRLLELERSTHPPRPGCIEAVDDRIAHWRFRASLPRRRRQRVHAVRAELVTGRYGRYAHGVRSALADLVYPAAPASD